MKKFFSVLTLVLSLLLFSSPFQSVTFAAEQPNNKIGNVVQVGKYKGVVISEKDLPKGIVPKVVKDMKEAEKVVDDSHNLIHQFRPNNFKLNVTKDSLKSGINPSIAYLGSDPVIQDRQDVVNGGPIPGCYFHVVANYTYCYNYYGSYFNSVNSISSYLSGLTAFISWSQTDYNYSFTETTLSTTVYGRLTDYLVTPIGLVAIGGSNETVYTNFYL
jgi:hypothetical protein